MKKCDKVSDTKHSSRVTLAAIGLKLRAIHLFGPVDVLVGYTMNHS